MELYLIRHAQSANNANPVTQRVSDPPLTDLGKEQARYLAEWIISRRLTKLISSPFRRALQTADHIRAATGLPAEVRIQLHEQGGCYSGYLPWARTGEPGLTREEIERQFPGFDIEPALDGEGWWQRRPYERRVEARRRAGDLLQRTRNEFALSSERIAFVMHADIKVLLLEHFHSEALDPPYNACVTRVSIAPNELHLIEYNQVAHLPTRLIT